MKTRPQSQGFTLIELMTVLVIITVLTGMVVGVSGLVNTKTAKARATAEIAMLGLAAEAYKSDNGTYPKTDSTDSLNPMKDMKPKTSKDSDWVKSNLSFYRELTGDKEEEPNAVPDADQPVYLKEFDPRIVKFDKVEPGKPKKVQYFQDPFGLPYGYSTSAAEVERKYLKKLREDSNADRPKGADAKGYNSASYDLWSTGGSNPSGDLTGKDGDSERAKWIKNW